MLLFFLRENTCLEAVLRPEESKALLMAAITGAGSHYRLVAC